jgi:DOPA 4,5-dioxygenase
MCGFYFDKGGLTKEWEKAARKIEGYDIHIYYKPEESYQALELSTKLKMLFSEVITGSGHVAAGRGPHTAPNYEVEVSREGFGKVLQWLQVNSENLSILIHPRTDDEHKDHSSSAMWLGEKVPFNNFFDKKPAQEGPRAG